MVVWWFRHWETDWKAVSSNLSTAKLPLLRPLTLNCLKCINEMTVSRFWIRASAKCYECKYVYERKRGREQGRGSRALAPLKDTLLFEQTSQLAFGQHLSHYKPSFSSKPQHIEFSFPFFFRHLSFHLLFPQKCVSGATFSWHWTPSQPGGEVIGKVTIFIPSGTSPSMK